MTIRAPLVCSIARGAPQNAGFVSVNLLATVLAVAAGPAPFYQTEWPNPQARVFRQDTSWIQNLNATTLAPAASNPFAQFDWTNPRGRSFIPSFAQNNLLGTTLANIPRIELTQVSWGSFAHRTVFQPGFQQNILQTTLASAPEPAPFYQVSWPNPQQGIARQGQQAQTAWLTVTSSPTPFNTKVWANPIVRPVQQDHRAPNLLLATLTVVAGPAPFYQTQWPLAFRAPVIAPHAYQYQNLHATTLYVDPGPAPFNQMDWPDPMLVQPRPVFESRNIALTLSESVTTPGLEFTLPEMRMHFELPENRMHFDLNNQ